MKVLFIADRYDPSDHDAASGVDYMIYKTLEQKGINLTVVGPFKVLPTLSERVYHRVHKMLFSKRPVKYPLSYLKDTAAKVGDAIRKVSPDVLFTKHAATVAHCEINKPLVYLMDTTLIGSRDQWPIFTNLAYKRMLTWEKRVIAKSSQLITNSDWSARILRDYYHVAEENITVYPNPASIPEEIVPKQVCVEERNFAPIRLLLVGREFHRKVVDIAIQVVRELNHLGHEAELRIVGLDGQNEPFVRYMGLYRKTITEELAGYVANYQWANFLIHPARFEAAGIVPGEAAAFGVPTITNAAGGLATTVADGISGVVLSKGSPPNAYVDAVLRYVRDKNSYVKLCYSTRSRYDTELNWQFAGQKIIGALERAAKG